MPEKNVLFQKQTLEILVSGMEVTMRAGRPHGRTSAHCVSAGPDPWVATEEGVTGAASLESQGTGSLGWR